MGFRGIDRENTFQGSKGVSDDGIFRKMDPAREAAEDKNIKRFV